MGGLQRPRAGLRGALCGFQHALPLSEPRADLSPSLRPPLQLGGCVQRTFWAEVERRYTEQGPPAESHPRCQTWPSLNPAPGGALERLQKADGGSDPSSLPCLLFEAPAVHLDFLEAASHPPAPAQPAPGPRFPTPFSRPCLIPSADPGAPSSRKPPGTGSACSVAAAPGGAPSRLPQLSPLSSEHGHPFYR